MSVRLEGLGDDLVKHEPLWVGVLQQAARSLAEIVDHPFQRFPLSWVFDCIQIHSTCQWCLSKKFLMAISNRSVLVKSMNDWMIMHRSATVNHDHLLQYMVNFNAIDKDYIVSWQSDLEHTKERTLHKPSQDQSKSTALGGVWNFAERCIRNPAFNINALACSKDSYLSTWSFSLIQSGVAICL